MGEYLKIKNGDTVKVGTCENLYYATLDDLKQEKTIESQYFLGKESSWRYRFPNPNEKKIKIGNYEYDKGGIHFTYPLKESFKLEHDKICVRTGAKNGGYGINHYITCPGAKKWEQTCSKRENVIPFEIVMQKYNQETQNLMTLIKCEYCGAMFSLNKEAAIQLIHILLEYHRNQDWEIQRQGNNNYWLEVANTIKAGYNL